MSAGRRSERQRIAHAFWQIVGLALESNRLSSEDASKLAEIRRTHRDTRPPRLDTVFRVAKLLHFAPETLLTATTSLLLSDDWDGEYNPRLYHLYRLGWTDEAAAVCEDPDKIFESVDAARRSVDTRNCERQSPGDPPLTLVSVYALIGYMPLADGMQGPHKDGET